MTLTTALFPGQTTPSRKLPYGRYGSQQLSLESMQNSPGSSLMGGSCSLRGAHSLPLPKQPAPSPQGPRMAPRPQVVISSSSSPALPFHAMLGHRNASRSDP